MSLSSRLALLAVTVFVSACGGGGGGGDSAPTPPAPAPAPAPSPAPPPPAANFELSGQVSVAVNTLIDGDVNDVNAPHVSNNDFPTAQALPNPVSLAGYVNLAGAGPAGRSQTGGDRSDYFSISAVAGQTVSLVVADPQASDIDLYLYDENRNEVDASEGTGRLESITIPSTGRYHVEAYAYSGAGPYVLALGQAGAQGAGHDIARDGTLLRSAEFVPGEVIVRWREPSQAMRTGKRSAAGVMSAHGLSKAAGAPEGDWLLKLDSPRRLLAQSRNARPGILASNTALSSHELKAATLQAIKRLRSDPAVLFAEPNYIHRALATPNDQHYPLQWHYPLINLPAAWDITTGSNAVTVAVIDTGVLLGHPDLAGQLIAGYDFITDPASAGDGNGPDNNPDDPGDHGMPGGESSFHGTHVAGTIAAATNNSIGVAGIAGGARIMPLRVLGRQGRGTTFDITQAVLYAAGLPNSSGTLPARRADIINLSLGGPSSSQSTQDAYSQARARGVIIVAAAGNEGNNVLFYPASYDGVISVSSVSIRRTLASYSNFGTRVDVAAPGGDSGDVNGDGYVDEVLSTVGNDSTGTTRFSYQFMPGTSMAAPHVAGVIALMKSVNPGLTPDDVDRLLAAGSLTTELGTAGRDDQFGHGLIDALKAVQAAQTGNTPTPAQLVATPARLSFAPGTSSQALILANNGRDALNVTSVSVSPTSNWLTITAPTAANGLGSYTVNVNRTALTAGTHSATIEIVSSANRVSVPVAVQVTPGGGGGGGGGGGAGNGDLGTMYILLVDPATMTGVDQVRATVSNGSYSFRFSNVRAGTYMLVAGSDPNNDDSICDVGEACGAFLTLDAPVRVVVDANRTGLSFGASYVTSIGASSAQSRATSGFKGLKVRR